jgi:hypothetical protein
VLCFGPFLSSRSPETLGRPCATWGIAPDSFTWKTSNGPYRGPNALQEGDEALFLEREREIRDCIRALSRSVKAYRTVLC